MSGMGEAGSGARQRLRNDALLIVVALLAFSLIGFCLIFTQKQGDTVCVSVNGEHYGTYSLHQDRIVEIVTEKGFNRLVIQNGKAFVEMADCPDGICAAHRPIDSTRESIVCLPHGVVISVVCARDANAPDFIV